MKIPLACADFTFPLLAHEDALELIGRLKFDGVDVGDRLRVQLISVDVERGFIDFKRVR